MADHYGHGVVLFRLFATGIAISGGTVALVLLGIWEDVRGLVAGLVLACIGVGAAWALGSVRLFLVGVPVGYLAGLYGVVLTTSPASRHRMRQLPLTVVLALGALTAALFGFLLVSDYYVVAQQGHHQDVPSTLDEYLTVLAVGGVQLATGAFVLGRVAYCTLVLEDPEGSPADASDAP